MLPKGPRLLWGKNNTVSIRILMLPSSGWPPGPPRAAQENPQESKSSQESHKKAPEVPKENSVGDNRKLSQCFLPGWARASMGRTWPGLYGRLRLFPRVHGPPWPPYEAYYTRMQSLVHLFLFLSIFANWACLPKGSLLRLGRDPTASAFTYRRTPCSCGVYEELHSGVAPGDAPRGLANPRTPGAL